MKWLTKLPFNRLDLNFAFSMHTWMSMCILIVLLEVIMELLLIHIRVLASWNQDWVEGFTCGTEALVFETSSDASRPSVPIIHAKNQCMAGIWLKPESVEKNSLQAFGNSVFTRCTYALNQLTLVVIYIFFIFLRTVWTFITIFSELMNEYKLTSMKLATS